MVVGLVTWHKDSKASNSTTCYIAGQTVNSLNQENPLRIQTDKVRVPVLLLCDLEQMTSPLRASMCSSVKLVSDPDYGAVDSGFSRNVQHFLSTQEGPTKCRLPL